ncbi:MAG TPA: hypothetical protein VMJ32_12890 [Pirellulales bacterium]|nr:hypothetical protein [Pirellulales bacterium]
METETEKKSLPEILGHEIDDATQKNLNSYFAEVRRREESKAKRLAEQEFAERSVKANEALANAEKLAQEREALANEKDSLTKLVAELEGKHSEANKEIETLRKTVKDERTALQRFVDSSRIQNEAANAAEWSNPAAAEWFQSKCSIDGENVVVTLGDESLPVDTAVAKLRADQQFWPLFKADKNGGTGSHNGFDGQSTGGLIGRNHKIDPRQAIASKEATETWMNERKKARAGDKLAAARIGYNK